MIVAKGEPAGDVLGEGPEALAHPLPDRLERFEPICPVAGVKADALGRTVVDGNEHRGLALAGHHRGQVATPHLIDPLGGDRAVMGSRATRPAGTLMRQQAVLAHQPQDAAAAGAEAGKAQPRPQLAVALAMKGTGLQELPDLPRQVLVRHCAEWPRSPAFERLRSVAMAVDGGP